MLIVKTHPDSCAGGALYLQVDGGDAREEFRERQPALTRQLHPRQPAPGPAAGRCHHRCMRAGRGDSCIYRHPLVRTALERCLSP